jgi:hypothetical protein
MADPTNKLLAPQVKLSGRDKQNLFICQVLVRFCTLYRTSVGNPWLRHSSHPQEKEGGPKKNKKQKKKKNTSLHSPA